MLLRGPISIISIGFRCSIKFCQGFTINFMIYFIAIQHTDFKSKNEADDR